MTSTAWLMIVGAAVVTIGSVTSLVPRAWMLRAGLAAQAAGMLMLGIGAAAVVVTSDRVGSAFVNALTPRLGVDALSGVFLVIIAVVAACSMVFARGALEDERHGRALAAATGLFALTLVAVVCARDAVTFLLAWELMSLVPAATIAMEGRSERVMHTVLVYLSITHVAGVGVWVSVLGAAHFRVLGAGGPLAAQPAYVLSTLVAAAIIGFGAKAGLVPLHTWLPRAHPVAPGHISALMSGVMVKVALYGLIRALWDWFAPVPAWVAVALLIIATVSALGGVVYASLAEEMKRLLAFSTVENVGIVTLALAASLLAADAHLPRIATLAFVAALFHIAAHAMAKGALFLGAGALRMRVDSLDLNQLGGVLRSMPRTGAAVLIGCLSMAGLPPLAGFVSEWLTMQSLLQIGMHAGGWRAAMSLLALAVLAAVVGIAVFTFVKLAGMVLLGPARRGVLRAAHDVPATMTVPQLVLAGSCAVLGILAAPACRLLAHAVPGVGARSTAPIGMSVTTLSLPTSGTIAPLALGVFLVVVVTVLYRARVRALAPATSEPWLCGQRPSARLRWTPVAFTKSFQLVLDRVIRPTRTVDIRTRGPRTARLTHETDVPVRLDSIAFHPIVAASSRVGAFVRRLQSGSLAAYLAYLLVTIVAGLAWVRLAGGGGA